MTVLIVEQFMAGSHFPHSRSPLVLLVLFQLVLIIVLSTTQIYANDDDIAVTDAITFEKVIRFATLQDLYPSVNHHDARLALELIMQKTILQKSYAYKVELHFIDKSIDVVDHIQKGGYDFVTLSGIDYFAYRDALHLDPILVPSKTDQPTDILLLLTRKGQTLKTIAQKKDRTLLIENGRSGDLSKLGLDSLLPVGGFSKSQQFFTKIRRVKKPGRAVIPVFFNQADACIVTRQAFDTINALNPQIGHELKALYQSKGLVRMMTCATPKPVKSDIEAFIDESVDIDHNPDTRQAMTIIQMKRFIHITSKDLEATQNLIVNHGQLALK